MAYGFDRVALLSAGIVALVVASVPVPADAGTVLCERKKRVRLRVDQCKPGETFVAELSDPASGVAPSVPAISGAVSDLEASLASVADRVENLDAALAAVEGTVLSASELALVRELLSVLSRVDLEQGDGTTAPTIRLSGVNLQIVDGSGSTRAPNTPGVGNLIVGYSENEDGEPRTGSHNLVVGPEHGWTSYGGFVAGEENTVSAPSSSVCGGKSNVASGLYSSVLGGVDNQAAGWLSSISGGDSNTASVGASSVSGGSGNRATGWASVVSGGHQNVSSGYQAVVSGGVVNEASGSNASVAGGGGNLAIGPDSTVSGGVGNRAEGTGSVVSGGLGNNASGADSTVSGGSQLSAPVDRSHVP